MLCKQQSGKCEWIWREDKLRINFASQVMVMVWSVGISLSKVVG